MLSTRMKKQILLCFLVLALCMPFTTYSAERSEEPFTTMRTIDVWTFNEYRYKITEKFFILRDKWKINGELDKKTLEEIGVLSDKGYKYLPDNLQNKNLLKNLLTDLQRWVKYPNNDANYTQILKSLQQYLETPDIAFLKWTIQATPDIWSAPMNVTFRADVVDPTGTVIPKYNYTWWFDVAGERVVIGRGLSLNYTFLEEWNYTVFLDVVSNHRNSFWNIDVLPFRSRAEIVVEEKVASVIVKVNGERVQDNQPLKFNPSDANYGLIFDATSSTPTGGARFIKTQWDFGNGIIRAYNGWPRIERIRYPSQWDYTVSLQMETNEGKIVRRNFDISIHDPIATIHTIDEEWYVGDSFTFSAKSPWNDRNFSYAWEIIDIERDEVILRKSDKLFTYVFTKKWKFNVVLKITKPNGETDIDTHIVYINSQAPVAEFMTKIPLPNKPNRVFFDASRTFDPDYSDDGKLTFTWFIDGEKVNLEEPNSVGSVGYYTFDSVGNHDVTLEVRDPDNITSIKKSKVEVKSILSVEMSAFPRVIQRESFIRFVAESPEAEIYEWDFWDGVKKWGSDDSINHTYLKSGSFNVQLKVMDADNKSNTFTKTVYVWESDAPVAVIDIKSDGNQFIAYDPNACSGRGAYVGNRVSSIQFDSNESINTDGSNSGLDYSWKIGNSKYATTQTVSHQFDEIGCFPVKLTVKSKKNGRTSSQMVYLDIQNELPVVTTLSINIENPEADPLVVKVNALWAQDPDGVIQSFLWYYYTDTDTNPQDFRSSTQPSTTFVLPKITGQYYFVVIMKDNNEARVTSEEATGSRFYTTVTWDNINTPLIDLKVNDSAVSIWEEVVFTAEVRDILGQDISKDSKFSWDFDGDGFYDMETTEKSITYKYKKSGTFYAKVKVKHKGISSTKNVTMNVSNKIVPDFEYISIGNKYVFFDTSNGELDTRDWNLWDGTKTSGKTFIHEYTDKKSSHEVTLKVSEGTKTKEVKKKVVRNAKNLLEARWDGINLFSVPTVSSDGQVTLENEYESFYVYLWESKWDIAAYAIDYDIDLDSDLNGSKDDDVDNKGTGSYTSWDVIEVPLNNIKEQTIRIFLISTDDSIIESRDITIIKSYIEEQNIDLDSIEFVNVTDSEKEKIEQLKELLRDLPQSQKLEAMNYVQRMQENWSDQTEKTRIIIDFETYLYDQNVSNVDEIITVLESLLVEGQDDTSAKNVAYNALKNLIPEDIDCPVTGEYTSCYEMLIAQLGEIKDSNDIEKNKEIGSSILTSIATTDTMTNAQKIDFKAILGSLVYGSVEDIPEWEKEQVTQEPTESDDEGGFMSILLKIFYWMWILILIILWIIGIYYIFYKLRNKDSSVGFQDYIINKTSVQKGDETFSETREPLPESTDVLGETPATDTPTTVDPLGWGTPAPESAGWDTSDPLGWGTPAPTTPDTSGETPAANTDETQTPDWLAGNTETPAPESTQWDIPDPLGWGTPAPTTPDTSNEAPLASTDETKVPDWLAGNTDVDAPVPENTGGDDSATPTSDTQDSTGDTSNTQALWDTQEQTDTLDIEKETQIDDGDVPDWLKQDFSSNSETQTPKTAQDSFGETDASQAEDIDDSSIPDWLKGSFDTDEDTWEADDTPADIVEDSTKKENLTDIDDEDMGDDEDIDDEGIDDEDLDDIDEEDVDDEDINSDQDEIAQVSIEDDITVTATKKPAKKTTKTKKTPAKTKTKKATESKQKKKTPAKTQKTTSASKTKKTESSPKGNSNKKPATKKNPESKKPAEKKKAPEKKTSSKKDSELWDDGMNVPDWLKTDGE